MCSYKLYWPLTEHHWDVLWGYVCLVLGWSKGFVDNSWSKRAWLVTFLSLFDTDILQFEHDRIAVVWGKRSILSAAVSVGVGKAVLEQSMLIESGRGSRWELRSADQSIITPSVSLCWEHCAIVLDSHAANVQYIFFYFSFLASISPHNCLM